MRLVAALAVVLLPLIITLVIELVGGAIMGVRGGKNFLLILLANIATNLGLTVCIWLLSQWFLNFAIWNLDWDVNLTIMYAIIYGFLEPLVIWIEYRLYKKHMDGYDHPLRLSLVLNILSMLGGIVCQTII